MLDNNALVEIGEAFTLKNVLSKNKGILSEITAKHVVLNELPPKLLTLIDDDDENAKSEFNYEVNNEKLSRVGESQLKKQIYQDVSLNLSTLLKDPSFKTSYGKYYFLICILKFLSNILNIFRLIAAG